MPEWLERELHASLAPVEAPKELSFASIARPLAHARGSDRLPARRVSAFLIAAAMVVLTAGTVWLDTRQPVRTAPARWNPAIRAQANDHNCLLCHTL